MEYNYWGFILHSSSPPPPHPTHTIVTGKASVEGQELAGAGNGEGRAGSGSVKEPDLHPFPPYTLLPTAHPGPLSLCATCPLACTPCSCIPQCLPPTPPCLAPLPPSLPLTLSCSSSSCSWPHSKLGHGANASCSPRSTSRARQQWLRQ